MSKRELHVGVVGLGGRGHGLVKDIMCGREGVHIEAVCDLYPDRVQQTIDAVKEINGNTPLGFTDYKELLKLENIDTVVVTSAWEAHIPVAIAAMKAGKAVASEVGGAYSVQQCWDLVRAHEETGMPCMLLENCCYGQRELMITNMVRQGVLGDIVHCAGGYQHDLRGEISHGNENRHYRLRNYRSRNCENYPTHELGPIAKLLDINNGNRMISLTATASCSKGLHEYIVEDRGPDHPLSKVEFAQGDIITTVIKCAKGQTIVLSLDTTLPRFYSRGFTIRGTKGSYFEDMDCIFQDKIHHEAEWGSKPIWGNAAEYEEQYQHPLWKNYDPKGGHGGMDYLVISAYLEAVKKNAKPPIDVYDAAAYMCITALSEESIQKGGAPIAIPDFTRGKWYMRNDIDHSLTFDLDCDDVFEGLY